MEFPAWRTFRFVSWRSAIAALASLAFSGCAVFLPPTPSPIRTIETAASPDHRSSTLVVFLPGRGSPLGEFESRGFVRALHDSGVNVDTISVDAHLGYYMNRTVIDRLMADVLAPARAHGYRSIVLVGLSLGGVGALLTEREHPGSVDALVLIAPYLGDKPKLFDEIAAAGGPSAWAKGHDGRTGTIEEQLWTFLGAKSSQLPPTWVLAGKDDYLAQGHRLLATLLPPERVTAIPGAHDWRTWTALWKQLCATSNVFRSEDHSIASRTD